MPKYTDIKIADDDLALEHGDAALIFDRDVILQDLRHALRESGLPTLLVGERDAEKRQLLYQKIEELAEEDPRIVPGTVSVRKSGAGRFDLVGSTYDFGDIRLEVTNA